MTLGSFCRGRDILTGVKSRLEDSDTVVLITLLAVVYAIHIVAQDDPISAHLISSRLVVSIDMGKLADVGADRTFSMCRRVVFPALSRPRKRSLACLLSKPRLERTS